ncbi:hypothetical protein [Paenibacillus pabuli]|uniref:hypothetical protein n=1 Tax=Paenibacillus pabuli TaxID=1472 RepID=UPI003CF907A8
MSRQFKEFKEQIKHMTKEDLARQLYLANGIPSDGIPWRKYDPTDRSIPSHIPHLVYDKHRGVTIAEHAKSIIKGRHYEWSDAGGYLVKDMTHWAPINTPEHF